ncbi:MAG: hypothetical protein AB7R55_02200 [Gemmatimonadales bacterium]
MRRVIRRPGPVEANQTPDRRSTMLHGARRTAAVALGVAALGLALLTSVPLQAQVRSRLRSTLEPKAPAVTSGRYRIVALGVRVDKETTDDMLERDGKRDEIYVAAGVQHFDRRDRRVIALGMARTQIMGDVNGFPTRLQAGSASSRGGIRTSDNVPAVADVGSLAGAPSPNTLPLLIWEGDLHDGVDVVVVEPEIWEWDGDPGLFDAWQRTTTWPTIGDPEVQDLIGRQLLGPTPKLVGRDSRLLAEYHAGHDVPIGGSTSPTNGMSYWQINALVVTREAVEKAFRDGSSIGGRPPATLEITRTGYASSIHTYRLYLRVERVP